MELARSCGILLHPTSLPGRFGIGDLGAAAFEFADWLHGAGQSVWQVLPLGPTGYGDSPYQCFSANAGNPLLISLEKLCEEGLLSAADLDEAPDFRAGTVNYGRVIEFKAPLLRKAAMAFVASEAFESFCAGNAWWLDDFAAFMALKRANGGTEWTRWDVFKADPDEIHAQRFIQFKFFEQWNALRAYCHRKGIRIMGDVPIYVAHDSSDVWAHRDLFQLDEAGQPTVVAGVPPDYFSDTGQLWGNPVYRWELLAQDGYAWWISRLHSAFSIFDAVRLDHFRGFEAYWEVPASETTAVNGRWVKGPGPGLFRTLTAALGPLDIVAENLGVITPQVEAMRHEFGYPGMAILQFAFGSDPQAPTFLPHNFPRDVVAYTGTHDNDTTVGWWNSLGGESTRSAEDIGRERDYALRYLKGSDGAIHWDFIRGVMASVARTVLVPMQDVLGLGAEARMNMPSRPSGNWRWRLSSGMEALETERRAMLEMSVLYQRCAAVPGE